MSRGPVDPSTPLSCLAARHIPGVTLPGHCGPLSLVSLLQPVPLPHPQQYQFSTPAGVTFLQFKSALITSLHFRQWWPHLFQNSPPGRATGKARQEKKTFFNLLDIIIEHQGREAVRGRGLGEKGSPKTETWYMASFLALGLCCFESGS